MEQQVLHEKKLLNKSKNRCRTIYFFCAILLFFCAQQNLYAQNYLPNAPITESGTYIVPPGVSGIQIEAVGGGGGGAMCSERKFGGGGGGGGAYATSFVTVMPGDQLTITIGSGGSGQSAASAQKNGGDSYVSKSGTTIVLAKGGSGVGNNVATSAVGGQADACIGQYRYYGGSGGKGIANSNGTAGGGGGAAGAEGNGGAGSDAANGQSPGLGGAGIYPGGNGGDGGGKFGEHGSPGLPYGGGGGGGVGLNGSSGDEIDGSDGAAGVVIVTYACKQFLISTISSSLNSFCEGSVIGTTNITFTATTLDASGATGLLPAGGYTITYRVNDEPETTAFVTIFNGSGAINNIVLPPSPSGNITITITNIKDNDNNCSSGIISNNTVTIEKIPLPGKPAITPDDLTICTSTGTGILTAEGTYINPAYQWYIDGQIMAQTTQTITINQSASYYVTVTDRGCTNSSDPRNYLVQANATAALIAANPVEACDGGTATLTASLAAGAHVTEPVFRWYASQTSTEVLGAEATFTTGILTTTVIHDTTFYVSVAGSVRYCENTPGNRKPVKVTIHPMPTVRITTDQSTTFCHNATIELKAEISGAYDWIGWYDEPLNSGAFLPNNLNVVDVTYNPLTSSQGKDLNVSVRVHNAGCGYISDIVSLHILPEPTAAALDIMAQPTELQNVCIDTFYVVRVVAPNLGDVTNLVLTLHDVNSTGLAIKADADIIYPDATTVMVTGTDPIQEIDRPGKQWNLPGTLKAGDFLDIKIKVQATCEDNFHAGTNLLFNLDAQSVCGDQLPRLEKRTLPFDIVQDGNYNTYNLTSQFRDSKGNPITKVTNNISDTIIWHLEASFKDYKKATDGDVELVNVLIPNGMKLIEGSYDPIQNMPAPDVVNITRVQQQNGLNVNISLQSGVTPQSDDGGKMIAELKFLATGAPCDIYEFYAKIDYKYSAYCVSNESTCTVNTTQGAAPDEEVLLEVERYRFEIDSLYSETDYDAEQETYFWDAYITVRALMDWYAGNTVYIDFYADDENDGVLYDGQQPIATHTYTTEYVPEGGTFVDHYTKIPVVPGKQLLAKVHGDAMCETLLSPMIVMTGENNKACQNDTLTFYTAENPGVISDYSWDVTVVDALSGATPRRIPVEGKTSVDDVPNVARIVWPAEGKFLVTTHYDLNGENLNSTYFPVAIEKAPSITFPDGKLFSSCAGTPVDIDITTEAASSVKWSNYAETGTATGTTTDKLHYVPFHRTSDTTIYIRITAYCLDGSVCKPVTDSVQVVIYGKPEFGFADATACGSVNLTTLPLVSGSIEKILDFAYWNEDFTEEVTNHATAITQSGTYHIVGISTYCSDTATVHITVKPIPQLALDTEEETICSGDPVPAPNLPSENGTSYSITSESSGAKGNSTDLTEQTAFPADLLTCTGPNVGVVIYSITPITDGCKGTPQTYTITVYPIPNLTIGNPTSTICSGSQLPSPMLSTDVTSIPVTYNIVSVASEGVTGNTSGEDLMHYVADTLYYTGTTSGTVVYTITPVVASCQGEPQEYTVTVNPLPIATVSSNSEICEGGEAVFTITLTQGTPPWSVYLQSDGDEEPISINGITETTKEVPIKNLPVGNTTYRMITVTDKNNCSYSPPEPKITN